MISRRKIGYSAWGFLGNGIVDTPDGGRSHRKVLISALIDQGADIIMLQKNRDLEETNDNIKINHLSFETTKLPEIDILFIEYRWPISGRNIDIDTNSPNYTPDLDRQKELIKFYLKKNIPILIWDKDQQLPKNDPIFSSKNVTIFEPALSPKQNRESLLFPIDSELLATSRALLKNYDKKQKSIDLVYIGNQYDRDESLCKYYEKVACKLGDVADVYGKWNGINSISGERFENINFHGRIGYKQTKCVYEKSFCTILIAPKRYYKNGQFTQRIFEAIWRHCVPLVPSEYSHSNIVVPDELIVEDSENTVNRINALKNAPDYEIVRLLEETMDKLCHTYSANVQARKILSKA